MFQKDIFQWIEKPSSLSISSVEQMIHHYQQQIEINRTHMIKAVEQISLLIQQLSPHNTVYLTGMGKSGYICKKSASTWISLSLPCIYLDLPNLPHGDFGILKQNDIILFISNSGNTEEIVYILKYLKKSFHKKVFTISIVGNENSEMEKYSNFTYVLHPIQEADMIGMTPSVSSSLFMMILDMIAIQTRKDITKKEFQMNHPSGSLGKK
jgi:arabinose-5-phosphate isomerase